MVQPGKTKKVQELTDIIRDAKSVILNDFTGLDVSGISELRRLCRESGVTYRVIKNTLAKRGFRELGLDEDTLVLFFNDHGVAGAKGSCYEGGVRSPAIVRWKGTWGENSPICRQQVTRRLHLKKWRSGSVLTGSRLKTATVRRVYRMRI